MIRELRPTTNGFPMARVRRRQRVLPLVDSDNMEGVAWEYNKKLRWSSIVGHLVMENGRGDLLVPHFFLGLPPATPEFRQARQRKLGFVRWLEFNRYHVTSREGVPYLKNSEWRFRANTDVMMAIAAMNLLTTIQPDVVLLLTHDSDFDELAVELRHRGIRVEVVAIPQVLGKRLRDAVDGVIDLNPLFRSFPDRAAAGRS